MDKNRKILMNIREISNEMKKIVGYKLLREHEDLSEMNACIILFLKQQELQKRQVFHKDIEREFRISRATVSQMISRMEKKKMIERRDDFSDGRRKQIFLTDSSRESISFLEKTDEQLEKAILEDFTEQEKNCLLEYMERIQKNINKLK